MPTDKQLAIKQLIEENKQLHMDTQKQNHNLFSVALKLKNKIKKLEEENKDLREKYIEQKKTISKILNDQFDTDILQTILQSY